MITYKIGNLLESKAEVLVNTVNTSGVMGKGIALQFKNTFPNNFKLYQQACKANEVKIGKLLITEDESLVTGKKIIVNFPTKTSWRLPSEYSYIEKGLLELVRFIQEKQVKSIAIPPLGSGNGGLDWDKVKNILENYLSSLDCDIYIYEPNKTIQEAQKNEKVKLTPARAMLLSVLFDLVKNGEFVSEFAAEKIAYFLQRFGGRDVFNLKFQHSFYGPYSGKMRHILYYLNGSYIKGYSSKDKKPFDEIELVSETEKDVEAYLQKPENEKYKKIAEATKVFLTGFYSSFALELLSTVDFIIQESKAKTIADISQALNNWSERKKILFNNLRFIEIAREHIEKNMQFY